MLQKYTFLRAFQLGRCHHCGFAALREIIFFSQRRQGAKCNILFLRGFAALREPFA
jgi:hypothetical protein